MFGLSFLGFREISRGFGGSSLRWSLALTSLMVAAASAGCSASTDSGTPGRKVASVPAATTGNTTPTTNPGKSPTPPSGSSTPTGAGTSPAATTPGAPVGVVMEDPDAVIVGTPDVVATSSASGGELIQGQVCSSKDIEFVKEIPTVLILVDRSSSMFASNLPNGGSGPFGTSPDRWEAMRTAMAALEPFATDVSFGLTTYTSNAQTAATCPELPQLNTIATAALGVDSFKKLLTAIPESKTANPAYKGETPTGASIAAGIAALQKVTAPGPKYLLVITDGDPDSCVNFDPQCGQDIAIGATQVGFTAGIKTYVIGISDDVDNAFLNDLAHAGQGLEVAPPLQEKLFCIQKEPKAGTTFDYNAWRPAANGVYGADGLKYKEDLFFKPKDVDTFTKQIKQVVNAVRSCEFKMDTAVVRASAGKGAVRLETAKGQNDLVYADVNGWSLAADNDYTVVLTGTACEDLKSDAEPHVKIEFPCAIRVPIVL